MNAVGWAHLALTVFRVVGPVAAGAVVGAGVVPPEWAGFINALFGGNPT